MLFCQVRFDLYLAGESYLLCFQDFSMQYMRHAYIRTNIDNDDDDYIALQLTL